MRMCGGSRTGIRSIREFGVAEFAEVIECHVCELECLSEIYRSTTAPRGFGAIRFVAAGDERVDGGRIPRDAVGH